MGVMQKSGHMSAVTNVCICQGKSCFLLVTQSSYTLELLFKICIAALQKLFYIA